MHFITERDVKIVDTVVTRPMTSPTYDPIKLTPIKLMFRIFGLTTRNQNFEVTPCCNALMTRIVSLNNTWENLINLLHFNIVACKTIARQQRRNKLLYSSRCYVTVPQTSMIPRQQENTAIMEAAFSTQSVSRCYKQGQLARRSLFIGEKRVLSSEKMLHKDYDRKGSVAKKNVTLEGLGAKTN
jgi:hypothetical protein